MPCKSERDISVAMYKCIRRRHCLIPNGLSILSGMVFRTVDDRYCIEIAIYFHFFVSDVYFFLDKELFYDIYPSND